MWKQFQFYFIRCFEIRGQVLHRHPLKLRPISPLICAILTVPIPPIHLPAHGLHSAGPQKFPEWPVCLSSWLEEKPLFFSGKMDHNIRQ